MRTGEKYITYREKRDCYQVKIVINGEILTKTCKTLEAAIIERDKLEKMFRLDSVLTVKISQAMRKKVNPKKIEYPLLYDGIVKWYNLYKKTTVVPTTRTLYIHIMEKLIKPLIGNIRVDRLNREIMQAFVNTLLTNGVQLAPNNNNRNKTGLSIDFVKRAVSVVKMYLCEMFPDLPDVSYNVKYPRKIRKHREAFNDKERDQILDFYKNHYRLKRYYPLICMYFETGCRRSELLGLRWCDINYSDKSVHIENTITFDSEIKEYVEKPTPKNETSIRKVYISDTTMLWLMKEYATVKKLGYKNLATDLVFRHMWHGKIPRSATITNNFRYTLRHLGIYDVKNVCLHSTRHSLATTLYYNKVPIKSIEAIGGWNNEETLFKYYIDANIEPTKEYLENYMFIQNKK